MVEKKKDLKKLWAIKAQLHHLRHLQCLKNRNFYFIKELIKLKLGGIS